VSDAPWLLVGLGNPGTEYEGTRHNIGALCADVIAARVNGTFSRHKRGNADVVEARLGGHRVIIAKPRSFMNTSGGPVKALADFYKVPLDRLVVLHDELDLPFGAERFKSGGGDNGHNGLRSVRAAMDSGDFLRVRLGIGRPPGRQDPADFVLRPFAAAERKALGAILERAADAVEVLIGAGLARAQQEYND
jgi:PTH1 family peptidyl-tRNA hydrolase